MKKKVFSCLVIAACLLSASCSNEDSLISSTQGSSVNTEEQTLPVDKKLCLQNFSVTLSKAIYANKEVREFLKREAVKQFDRNYDVLYYPLKDQKVSGDKTFRDILVSYSSEKEMKDIERSVPLLNILIPRISFLNVFPEKLDVEDAELPVAIQRNDSTDLLLNGEKVSTLPANEFPGFNVVVVNENIRVSATKNVMTRGSEGELWSYEFKNESYRNDEPVKTRSGFENTNRYKKAREAFEVGFNRDDNSDHQRALQRDYIYFGMTPEKTSGQLNKSVTEYLSFIEVDPKVYTKISDQEKGKSADPRIIQSEVHIHAGTFTHEQLINLMWTQGAYNFIIEIGTSVANKPIKVIVPAYPDDIWDFHIKTYYRHGTMWRHFKNTYTIDPRDFTAKRYYLNPGKASLGKWDITQEGLSRYVSIYEEDNKDQEITETITYSFNRIKSSKFKGDVKVELGLGNNNDKGNVDVSTEVSSSNTFKEDRTITMRKTESYENLGNIWIYFYDPIIDSRRTLSGGSTGGFGGHHIIAANGGNRTFGSSDPYQYHVYDTGSVRFGVDVR